MCNCSSTVNTLPIASLLSFVYVKQASLSQVIRHGESTELHYRLVERTLALGWPRERFPIIDDDLGKSGTGTKQRPGFQQIITEMGLARVGLLISLDVHRAWRVNIATGIVCRSSVRCSAR